MKSNLRQVNIGNIGELNFNVHGLIPAVVQDVSTGEVLMLAYMNKESLTKSLEEGKTCFYSRSREKLWTKGETSGNYQYIEKIAYDCDADTLLVFVNQQGVACHLGTKTCFETEETGADDDVQGCNLAEVVGDVFAIIEDRKEKMPEGSYTTYLFNKGLDKILKKVGEEAAEVIIAAKNEDKEELIYEASDLVYHLLVLLSAKGLSPEHIARELEKRK
ncbi:bifunctional phosphoribosyl-AMP cyclohydrolase/phosphoribosyl-ATP diphosphatase HisIE [Desulfitispora alkaliphila]|uniref:bifunctional phosphoribosyl-AMP cyclohydrolase/phosphoribosyl-ATP diphosphatase HisIE n=1 Tax=Desulfitispora alkaliphila TaxID=622674 RepID=UPI003D253372